MQATACSELTLFCIDPWNTGDFKLLYEFYFTSETQVVSMYLVAPQNVFKHNQALLHKADQIDLQVREEVVSRRLSKESAATIQADQWYTTNNSADALV